LHQFSQGGAVKEVELQNNLRKLRFEKGDLTQEVLADKLGVSRQTVYAIEKGKFNPSITLALQIAGFFGVGVEEVFNLKEEVK
jgi:putative transcriptional regulator